MVQTLPTVDGYRVVTSTRGVRGWTTAIDQGARSEPAAAHSGEEGRHNCPLTCVINPGLALMTVMEKLHGAVPALISSVLDGHMVTEARPRWDTEEVKQEYLPRRPQFSGRPYHDAVAGQLGTRFPALSYMHGSAGSFMENSPPGG